MNKVPKERNHLRKARHPGQAEMKLQDAPACLIGLDEIFTARTHCHQRQINFRPQQVVERGEIFLVARRYKKIPIHREARHAGEAHGLSAHQQVTNARRVEGKD